MRKIISANIANITKGELFPFNGVHHLLQILEEYVHFQGMCTDISSNYDMTAISGYNKLNVQTC